MRLFTNQYYLVYLIMFLLYISHYFTGIEILGHLTIWVALFAIFISWFAAAKIFKIVSAAFIAVSLILGLLSGQTLLSLYEHTLSNIPLVMFFSMMPWISVIFRIGGMKESLTQTIQDKNNYMPNIYLKTFLNSGFLSVFLNISGTYIVQNIIIRLFSNENIHTRNDIIGTATARAFAVMMMSAPLELIVVISIDYTGVQYLTMLPWLFIISFIGFLTEIIYSRKAFGDVKVDLPYTEIDNRMLIRSLIKMMIILVIFVAIVILVSQNTELSFIFTIGLALFPFSLITSALLGFAWKFLKEGSLAWKHHNNHLQNFVVLFIPLGIFSGAFSNSALPGVMQSLLSNIGGSMLVIFIVAALFIGGMSLLGIHSVASVAIIYDVLLPVIDEASLLSFIIVVVAAGVGTTAYSPYSTVANVTVQNINISPYFLLRRNKGFAVRMMVIAIIVATILLYI